MQKQLLVNEKTNIMARHKTKTDKELLEIKRLCTARWRNKNKERISESNKDYYDKNREAILLHDKEYNSSEHGKAMRTASRRKRAEELYDSYAKKIIQQKFRANGVPVTYGEITPEQVELQKETIQIKRIIKSIHHEKQ